MRFADLDAVTVDGYGTLVRLVDPVPALSASLAERGVSCDTVGEAFLAEVAYYKLHALCGRDTETLTALRLDCTRVFLEAAGADLDPATFVDAFIAAIVMEPEPGAEEAVRSLRARGLDLAIVSNWDIGLVDHLGRLDLAQHFSFVATTAEAGAPKPDPAVFRLALERLGVDPGRALHIGDEDEDEAGAAAAGMRFARAPLAAGLEGWA